MKKLYRKGTVHPSPPTISDQLSFLPATILTLTVALSPEDREVLAYLISSNSFSSSSSAGGANTRRTPKGVADGADHPALFHCSCFRCYMSYWVRWDSSPNHQLIHEIIDAFEEWLAQNNKGGGGSSRKEKIQKKNKRGGGSSNNNNKSKCSELVKVSSPCKGSAESESVLGEAETSVNSGGGGGGGGEVVEVGEGGGGFEDDEEKGSVRRFVSFIGERIWGAWGQ